MMLNKEFKTTFTPSLWCNTLTTKRLQVKLHFHFTFTPNYRVKSCIQPSIKFQSMPYYGVIRH